MLSIIVYFKGYVDKTVLHTSSFVDDIYQKFFIARKREVIEEQKATSHEHKSLDVDNYDTY